MKNCGIGFLEGELVKLGELGSQDVNPIPPIVVQFKVRILEVGFGLALLGLLIEGLYLVWKMGFWSWSKTLI